VARTYDYPLEWIDKSRLADWVQSGRFDAAAFDPLSGHLHPLKYCLGLADAAMAAGVRIYENSAVHRIERGETVMVKTAQGACRCKSLVLAGSDRGAETAYHRSKFAADEVLRSLDVRSTVVQPSLIYAAEGKSTNFFHRLAVLPLLVLPRGGMVQPVHIRDVLEGVGRLIERRPDGAHTVAFVGPFPLSLRAYLAALRRGLGLPAPVVCITLPNGVFRWLGSAAG
jgi:uncharacterized protein YbjT (DUF2867 family)